MENHTFEICLALGVVVPLISFVVLAFWGSKIGKPMASYVALAAITISCLLSTYVLIGWCGLDVDERATLTADAERLPWATMGDIKIDVGVKLDSLTVIMFFMVSFVAACIHFFSIGYMEGHSDEIDGQCKYHRFFAYFGLFSFSMLGLVVSSSLLFLFIFWELVGLCSYLLIGFYFDKKFASDAAIKAFVTNRVGDLGFIIGLAIVVLYLGTFDLDEAAVKFAGQHATGTGIFAASINLFGWQISGTALATMMGIGLFCGAMGKSAQFPLHVWLPDAMAGPTPVSALIHAATMVAAGVYLVARIFRLLTPDAQMFVAVIGCITLTITALIAIVQTDIKKILAYSTLSQLGYMIFGLGIGAWTAALFHLMAHAFFKAMLFLGSGQVIEGCHHEQNILKMGGLRKKMPVTCWTFFVGVLAIAGFGIPGAHLGLGGYFSKDEILAVAYERTHNWSHAESDAEATHSRSRDSEPRASARADDLLPVATASEPQLHSAGLPIRLVSASDRAAAPAEAGGSSEHGDVASGHHATGTPAKTGIAATIAVLPKWMFWLPIIIAYVTPFYMMRCWWLTFCGKPRDAHVYEHAHENWKMYVPLVALAIGTIVCSYTIFRPLLADASVTAADAPAVVAIDGVLHAVEDAPRGKQTLLTLTHGGEHDPHAALEGLVGYAWILGMGLAVLIYLRGLWLATKIKTVLRPLHTALEQKLYFDHVYDLILVGGIKLCGIVAFAFDKYIIDGAVAFSAFLTRSIGVFTGRQLDMPVKRTDWGVVDALANGIAGFVLDAGSAARRPQTGRLRTYVMIATGTVAIVLLCILFGEQIADGWSRIVTQELLATGD